MGRLHLSRNVHAAESSCQLNSAQGAIQHVIYIQFDNTHFTRDNPKVPSDLEQMPNLLNFIENNGTLLTNHHTPLIAHTAAVRNGLASQMITILEQAEFNNQPVNTQQAQLLIDQGNDLLQQVDGL